MTAAADAPAGTDAAKLEEVRRLVAWVAADASGDRRERTHAPNCYQWHAGCLALAVNRVLEGRKP